MIAFKSTELLRVAYTSTAVYPIESGVYQEVAAKSAIKNKARNITGMMMIHNGLILQFLEGENDAVQSLCEKISSDPRHTNMIVMSRTVTTERVFGKWYMGYEVVEGDRLDDYIFGLRHNGQAPSQADPVTKLLVNNFFKSSGLARA